MSEFIGTNWESDRSATPLAELLRRFLSPEADRVLSEMSQDWSHPAADLARGLAMKEGRVAELYRAFAALGWAERHPYFSEDDNCIRGSGYWLTKQGAELRRVLSGALSDCDGNLLPGLPIGDIPQDSAWQPNESHDAECG